MIGRILVAVDDSPAALAAVHTAIELAVCSRATLRVTHVLTDHQLSSRISESESDRPARTVAERRRAEVGSLLRHMQRLAQQAGVEAEIVVLEGEAAQEILAQARSWPADLVVVGRSGRTGAGQPYVGHETRHVLEFADQPVLVVPAVRRQ